MNSFLLFNIWLSSKCSIRFTFSAEHSGQKLIFVLPYTFLAIDHLILDNIFSSFNDHIYFDNSVLFLHCAWLKFLLWFRNLSLKDVSRSFCKVDFVTFICVIFNISSVYLIRRKILILQWAIFSHLDVFGGSRS